MSIRKKLQKQPSNVEPLDVGFLVVPKLVCIKVVESLESVVALVDRSFTVF
jgi:hypothetical protein